MRVTFALVLVLVCFGQLFSVAHGMASSSATLPTEVVGLAVTDPTESSEVPSAVNGVGMSERTATAYLEHEDTSGVSLWSADTPVSWPAFQPSVVSSLDPSFHVFEHSMGKELRQGDVHEFSTDALAAFRSLEVERESSLTSETLYEIEPTPAKRRDALDRLLGDQARFYATDNMLVVGVLFGVGAVFANTSLDPTIQRHAQTSLHRASTDEWLHVLHANKELGNGVVTLPIMGTAWLASEWIDGPPAFETVGLWGERSVRGVLVGAVPLLVTQRLTGGSRPNETEDGAGWHPFQDNNGVSGHAFMSSIPFITAAKMSDNVVGKAFWYSASLLGPLSRINDNAHYPSQVGLGWAMGFLAASAVQHNDTGKKGWAVVPEASFQSTGLAFQYRW